MANTGTYSRAALATRRFRFIPRSAWLGARARNVLQRPWRLLAAGSGFFVAVLAVYLVLPAGVRGALHLVRASTPTWVDTTQLVSEQIESGRRLAASDSVLADIRSASAALLALATPVELSAERQAERDAMAAEVASLERLLQRAEGAPLPESFRALAAVPALAVDRTVRALLDTLAVVERERDEIAGGATVDPVYVAITTQLNDLGRRIAVVGRTRLEGLRRELTALESAATPLASDSALFTVADTTQAVAERSAAFAAFEKASRALAEARLANVRADSLAQAERAGLQLAPIPVLVAAAGVIAFMLSFALAMYDEMRDPRVADAVEAERLTSVRVLAVARRRDVPADRSRRATDREIPSALDPTFDGYRVLSWHLNSQWPRDGIVTVTGDDPLVSATVAANLAAVLANDARGVLLVDADLAREPVRGVLGLRRSPGLAAVVENRRKWSEALVPVVAGRGRTMDVLPGGGRQTPLGPAESQVLVGEVQRAARRHDATIVVTSLSGAKRFRAGDDVVVCATQTRTRLSTLARTVASLVDQGARVRGVVLWSGALASPRTEG